MSALRGTAAFLLLTLAGTPFAVAGDVPSFAYVLARGQSALWQVDLSAGDRRLLELSDHPEVMALGQASVTAPGEVIFTTTNAAQRHAIFAFNPASGSVSGVSGPIDVFGEIVRGAGPPLEPATSGLVLSPSGSLYALRSFLGPMGVSVATGDRSVISQSVEPMVGFGHALGRPIDLAIESAGSLLIMDEYEGLVRVRLVDGARTMAFPSTLFIEPPVRFDLPLDGRIVHCIPGTDAVFVFDPRTGVDAPMSGRGYGSGHALGALADLAVHPGGGILAIDVGGPALISVDPATGDRTVISGPARGGGEGLPTAIDRPTLATFAAPHVPADQR